MAWWQAGDLQRITKVSFWKFLRRKKLSQKFSSKFRFWQKHLCWKFSMLRYTCYIANIYLTTAIVLGPICFSKLGSIHRYSHGSRFQPLHIFEGKCAFDFRYETISKCVKCVFWTCMYFTLFKVLLIASIFALIFNTMFTIFLVQTVIYLIQLID